MSPAPSKPSKNKFLLAIDIGNTSTSFALFSPKKPFHSFPLFLGDLPTPTATSKLIFQSVQRWLEQKKIAKMQIDAIYVSSVVPTADILFAKALVAFFRIAPIFISAKNISTIKIKYPSPKEVGADRIVNARAAIEYHKGPLIVVDFGTAITFDCVSAKKEYLGGVISPGPVISAEALYQKTAKLPRVVLKSPAKILGRNTLESIEAGLYHGCRGLVKEIITNLKLSLGKNTYVIATGGQAQWLLKGLTEIDQFISELTLRGLFLLWKDHSQISSR